MVQKEKLICLFDRLNESEQKAAIEFMQSLASRGRGEAEREDVLKLHGKNYFVLPD